MRVYEYWHNRPKVLDEQALSRISMLTKMLNEMPFPTWPNKSKNGIKKNENNNQQLCGLQSVMNEWTYQKLVAEGFSAELPVNPLDPESNLRIDFGIDIPGKGMLLIESEYGNQARITCDLTKLTEAWRWKNGYIGILICPLSETQRFITGSATTFEASCTRLKIAHPDTFPCPILVLGISHEGAAFIDLSQSRIANPDHLSANHGQNYIPHVVRELIRGVAPFDIGYPLKSGETRAKPLNARGLPKKDAPQASFWEDLACEVLNQSALCSTA